MKNRILFTLLFIVLFILNIVAQPKLIKETTTEWDGNFAFWQNKTLKLYEYSEDELTVRIKQFSWDTLIQDWSPLYLYERVYDENGNQLLYNRYDWSTEISDWVLNVFSIKEYNENNCLIYSESGSLSPYSDRMNIYEYYENCHKKSHLILKKSESTGQWIDYKKTDYFPNEDYTHIEYQTDQWIGSSSIWLPTITGHYLYDSQRRLKEHEYSIQSASSSKDYRYVNNFAPDGSYETYYRHTKDENDAWQVESIDSIRNIYNEKKERIKFTHYSFTNGISVDWIGTHRNRYYCDGLIKENSNELMSIGSYRHIRTISEYDELTECEEDQETKLTISPNPASAITQINSPLLSQENAEISVFTVSGILVQKIIPEVRSESLDLDIENLVNGTYIIQVTNDYSIVSIKLIVL